MKYLTIILFVISLLGCASNRPDNTNTESQNRPVHVDFNKLEDETTAPFYLAYAMAKSMWTPTYLSDGSVDQLAEEVYSRTMMLQVWKEAKAGDPEMTHPVLNAMENVLDAGYLREATWLQHRDVIKNRPDDLDLHGLTLWLDQNPEKLVQANNL